MSLSSPSASHMRAVPCPCCCHGASCPTASVRLTSSLLLPLLRAAQEDLMSFPTQSFRIPAEVLPLSQPSLWNSSDTYSPLLWIVTFRHLVILLGNFNTFSKCFPVECVSTLICHIISGSFGYKPEVKERDF